ncbi:MAG TPA: hypothetical protein VIL35_00530 [Vicinamibacterales bacterium]
MLEARTARSGSFSFLRQVLLADAVASGMTGLLMLLGSVPLEPWLAIPVWLLRAAGAVLVPYAAWVAWLAGREQPSRAAVWTVVVCNALWAIDCVLLLLTGWVQPTLLGTTFLLVQALVVLAFAELQYVGLRRTAATA